MKLLVSGSRDYNDYDFIKKTILSILTDQSEHTIIHGGCRGVDSIADKIALENGWDINVFNPDWSKGKIAGPQRNQQMIDEGQPDYAVLFMSKQSKGTLDMKRRLDHHNIKYTLIFLD